jgi:ankyrin repeat protein
MGTNIYDEIKLLSRNLEPEYPKKDIYYYIYKGNLLELGNYLLEDKSDIDKFTDEKNDNYKETPLISAIKAGMESCALMLIRYGANVDLAIRKHTTLHHAVHAHSYSVCRKLIEMNKDLVNTPNVSWGRTPLFDIIPYLKNQPEDSNDFRIFDLLLQNNADLFHKALNKVTPMDLIETSEKHYKNNLKEYIRVNYPRIKLDSN